MVKINFMVLNVLGDISGAKAYLEEMEKAIPLVEESKREMLDKQATEENWDWDEY